MIWNKRCTSCVSLRNLILIQRAASAFLKKRTSHGQRIWIKHDIVLSEATGCSACVHLGPIQSVLALNWMHQGLTIISGFSFLLAVQKPHRDYITSRTWCFKMLVSCLVTLLCFFVFFYLRSLVGKSQPRPTTRLWTTTSLRAWSATVCPSSPSPGAKWFTRRAG